MKYYTDTHEWVEIKQNEATVGVTFFAQKELGDIVYVELPSLGKQLKAGDEIAVLESTKAAADVYSPLSGKVKEINGTLKTQVELINQSPEEKGWLVKLEMTDASEIEKLLKEQGYKKLINQ